MVAKAHALGRRAHVHACSTEGIRHALDAGFDTIIHCNFYDPDNRYAFTPDLARRIAD